jgi:hypothetical protein
LRGRGGYALFGFALHSWVLHRACAELLPQPFELEMRELTSSGSDHTRGLEMGNLLAERNICLPNIPDDPHASADGCELLG